MFNALLMSFVGLEWYILNSSGSIKVVPLGMIICYSFIILCNRSFCNSLSEKHKKVVVASIVMELSFDPRKEFRSRLVIGIERH